MVTLDEIAGEVKKASVSVDDMSRAVSKDLHDWRAEKAALTRDMEAVKAELAAEKRRSDLIEVAMRRTPLGVPPDFGGADKAALDTWRTFMRKGEGALQPHEQKTLMVGDNPSGGYLAPDFFVGEVLNQVRLLSPVRQYARFLNSSAEAVTIPRRLDGVTASWVGEIAQRPTDQPEYGQLRVSSHELAVIVEVSNSLLEDAAINIESEVGGEIAERFAIQESQAFINGNGVAKPHGFLVHDDLVQVPSGSNSEITSDSLITLFYSVKAPYRANGTWFMNASTLARVRKLKEDGATGAYLWQPSLRLGQPEMILGRPVAEMADMPDVATNSLPIAFGDWRKGYLVMNRTGLNVLRDPYTARGTGCTRFHASLRVGGDLIVPEAIAALKIATS